MIEDINKKPMELTDEQAANVAGGMAPEGYTVCTVRYDYDRGTTFCGMACQYKNTNDCMQSYCRTSLCEEVKTMYHKWIGN